MIPNWSQLLNRPEIQVDRRVLEPVLRERTIAITGAGGSIGAALAEVVSSFGPRQLVLLDAHEASLVRLDQHLPRERSGLGHHLVLADVRDRRKIDQTFRRFRPDVVFHLAAYKQVPLAEANVDQVLAVNVIGTLNVVEAARASDVATVVYPSTDKAVAPAGLYGASKRIVERFLQALAEETARPAIRLVRLVNVFGTNGSVVEVFVSQVEAGLPLGVTNPQMARYWITMAEAIHLLLAAAGRPRFEGIYLLDVGEPVPIVETARKVYELLRPGAGSPPIALIGSRPGERLHELLGYPDEVRTETGLPGLHVLRLPASKVDARAWLGELRWLRERLYEIEPADLRAWAFETARAESLPELRVPEVAPVEGR